MVLVLVGWCSHGDKSLRYIYKVRYPQGAAQSGLADCSRLRTNSTTVYRYAGIGMNFISPVILQHIANSWHVKKKGLGVISSESLLST